MFGLSPAVTARPTLAADASVDIAVIAGLGSGVFVGPALAEDASVDTP